MITGRTGSALLCTVFFYFPLEHILMRYRCLILDHDDTAVDSTPLLHYPAHVEVMRQLRPGIPPVDLDGWMRMNFSPGIMAYLQDELGFTEDEIEEEYRIWQNCIKDKQAEFFPGFIDCIREFHDAGGILAVISHSTKENILKDYASAGAERLIQAVYGWEHEPDKRKPSPYPVQQILRQFGLRRKDVLVVDDLKPAVSMARAAGVAIGAAGWGIRIPEIGEEMRRSCDYYFADIQSLRDFLLED